MPNTLNLSDKYRLLFSSCSVGKCKVKEPKRFSASFYLFAFEEKVLFSRRIGGVVPISIPIGWACSIGKFDSCTPPPATVCFQQNMRDQIKRYEK